MRQVREISPLSADPLGNTHRLGDAHVRRMESAEQGVENEHLRSGEEIDDVVGDLLRISDVLKRPDALSEDLNRTVEDSEGKDLQPS